MATNQIHFWVSYKEAPGEYIVSLLRKNKSEQFKREYLLEFQDEPFPNHKNSHDRNSKK